MKKNIGRVLAVDLRAQRFGYVVFEGSGDLLDWGMKSYVGGDRASLKGKFTELQMMYSPAKILVREYEELNSVRRAKIRRVFYVLKTIAPRMVVVTLRSTDHSTLRRLFAGDTKINKHDIAHLVARRFPELSWRIPPKRQVWQSESASQPLFDAAGLGVLHFAREDWEKPNRESPPD